MQDLIKFQHLSFGGLDPFIVGQCSGKIVRLIPNNIQMDRWKNTKDFILKSQLFVDLMNMAFIPPHNVNHPFILPDGNILIEVEKIPYAVRERSHTAHMRVEAYKHILDMLIFMESNPNHGGFYAADCHNGNVLFHYCQPKYVDTGSFSNCAIAKQMAIEHIHNFCFRRNSIPMNGAITFEQMREQLECVKLNEPVTEWSGYKAGIEDDPEVKLILRLINNLGETVNSVFDAGCGFGRFSIPIAETKRAVVALDCTPQLLNPLFDEARKRKLPITCVYHDLVSEIPSDILKCDLVLASSVTHHLFKSGLDWDVQAKIWDTVGAYNVLVEFIGPDDPHMQKWNINHSLYNRERFLSSLNPKWVMLTEVVNPMPNEEKRSWFLFQRR